MDNRDAAKSVSDLPAGVTQLAPRVLVVDDDPGTVLLMSEMMRESGFAVAEANTGLDAIKRCAEFKPDLVLLDSSSPGPPWTLRR